MTPPPLDPQPTDPQQLRAVRILRLSRNLAHLDTAVAARRQALDELADRVGRLRGEEIPATLLAALEAESGALNRTIAMRDRTRRYLELVAPTVPVRVYAVPATNRTEGTDPA